MSETDGIILHYKIHFSNLSEKKGKYKFGPRFLSMVLSRQHEFYRIKLEFGFWLLASTSKFDPALPLAISG